MNGSELSTVQQTPAPDESVTGSTSGGGPRRGWLRWLLPLGVGLLLLALLNWGLYGRLVNTAAPDSVAAPTPAPTAPVQQAGFAEVEAVTLGVGDPLWSATFTDGVMPDGWQVVAGDWRVENGAFVQAETENFDRAAVYSDLLADYVLRVRFQLLEGTSAGVLFNAPGTDSKSGSHMVRFSDDGTGLFWGHFGGSGDFQGQGYAATGAPGDGWHVLEVYSGESSYAIRLDGVLVAQGIPLLSSSGHIGLTTSNSSAAFAAVEVFDRVGGGVLVEGQPQTIGDGELAYSTISGDWVQEGAVIRQLDPTATDFMLGTGVSAENYTLALTVTLPAGEEAADAGAGVVFHMPARDQKAGAHMVRFVNGGEGLSWGAFDQEGNYTGQGYVRLDLAPGEPQQLTLAVRGNLFDVLINDEAVVEDVPAAAGGGWIGLLSYRGPVSFADVQLALGSVVP